jgi:hypothetical protein
VIQVAIARGEGKVGCGFLAAFRGGLAMSTALEDWVAPEAEGYSQSRDGFGNCLISKISLQSVLDVGRLGYRDNTTTSAVCKFWRDSHQYFMAI